MTFAMNIDPHNPGAWSADEPHYLYDRGIRGARFTSRQEDQPKYDALANVGLELMSIITWESQGYVPYNATYLQIHNEMTSGDDPMTPYEYALEYNTYVANYKQAGFKFVTGGLARGPDVDIPWLEEVLRNVPAWALPDAIAIHPYTLDPADARNLFDLYWNTFQIPIIAT